MIKNNVNEGIETVNKRTSKVITGWSCDSGMGVNTFHVQLQQKQQVGGFGRL